MINNITSDLDNTFLIYEDEKGNEYKQPVADVQVAGTMDFIILDVEPLSELMMKPSNCESSCTVCAAASKVLDSDACLSPVMSMRSW